MRILRNLIASASLAAALLGPAMGTSAQPGGMYDVRILVDDMFKPASGRRHGIELAVQQIGRVCRSSCRVEVFSSSEFHDFEAALEIMEHVRSAILAASGNGQTADVVIDINYALFPEADTQGVL